MESDGLALPAGSSHATEHSVRELLFMYGEFMRLKCLDWVNYSLFCPAKGSRRKKKAEKCIWTPPVATTKNTLACNMWQNIFNYRGEVVATLTATPLVPSPNDVEPCCIISRNVLKTTFLPTRAGQDEALLWQWAKIPGNFLSTDVFDAEYHELHSSISMFWHRGGHLINS